MTLHYDRIRQIVADSWAKNRVESMESRVAVDIPENEIEPQDSFLMKDQKIPICFKNEIARKLYENESEEVKAEVRAMREAEKAGDPGRMGNNKSEVERLALVRRYNKYVQACRTVALLTCSSQERPIPRPQHHERLEKF